jgi:hypothetical protein
MNMQVAKAAVNLLEICCCIFFKVTSLSVHSQSQLQAARAMPAFMTRSFYLLFQIIIMWFWLIIELQELTGLAVIGGSIGGRSYRKSGKTINIRCL